MLNIIKVRLYPTKSQQSLIHQHFGSCRLVYNLLLDAIFLKILKIILNQYKTNINIYVIILNLNQMVNISLINNQNIFVKYSLYIYVMN